MKPKGNGSTGPRRAGAEARTGKISEGQAEGQERARKGSLVVRTKIRASKRRG